MINRDDLIALQSFVTEKDNSQYDDLHADTLLLDITHSNLKQRHVEIRFDKHTTISSLRDKVRSQRVTGSVLSFFVHNNATFCVSTKKKTHCVIFFLNHVKIDLSTNWYETTFPTLANLTSCRNLPTHY